MSLPEVIQHQDFLLTLNTNEESIIKDALPGVDVYPLFLDPENGTWWFAPNSNQVSLCLSTTTLVWCTSIP